MNQPPRLPTLPELLQVLETLRTDPRAKLAASVLERLYPETAGELRAALEQPGETLGRIAARVAADALKEATRDDDAIARGLAAFFGTKRAPKPPARTLRLVKTRARGR